ncbi:UNVERIFIED_CONTAM: hypothetical protein GTU68_047316 [Idotea baltica]|nr:hypothetical protein [Idotea baltica]
MNKVVLVILALFLPPVAVFFNNGMGKDLAINILLSILLFVPGVLHALWLVTR